MIKVVRAIVLSLLIGVSTPLTAQTNTGGTLPPERERAALTHWQAGQYVSNKAVEWFGINHCFVIDTISSSVLKRMTGKSYPKDCPINLQSLRYLKVLHVDSLQKIRLGEIVCNERIAADLIDIFRKLYDAKYPIELITLVDNYDANDEASMTANNTSCFCFRKVPNTTVLSKHARGLAIDINPLYNPFIQRLRNGKTVVQPATATPYQNRKKQTPYTITPNDLLHRLFLQHGFTWGGYWRNSKDYQHYEKK